MKTPKKQKRHLLSLDFTCKTSPTTINCAFHNLNLRIANNDRLFYPLVIHEHIPFLRCVLYSTNCGDYTICNKNIKAVWFVLVQDNLNG